VAPSARIFIIVRAPNGDVREVPIGPTAVVIGRDESADIRVEDKKVSRRHAAFKLIDGEPWVEDLGSANGVKLNGKRVEKRARFGPQDKVKVGGYQITLRDLTESTGSSMRDDEDRSLEGQAGHSMPPSRDDTPSRPVVPGARPSAKRKKSVMLADDGRSPVLEGVDEPVRGQRFVLKPGENIIGRLEECDIPVLDGSVSRQHARVVYARDRVSITDLGASNGTFVNETRIEMAELMTGDVVRIGNIKFKVELPPELSKPGTRTRLKREKKSETRPWATAGILVLLLAIAVLSATIYWRWRTRGLHLSWSGLTSMLSSEDGGASQSPSISETNPPVPDASVMTSTSSVHAIAKAKHTKTVGSSQAVARTEVTATATSPFGRKDANGLPIDLPEVDEHFDFDAFVSEKLAAAATLEKEGDFGKVRPTVLELLAKDPINHDAKEILTRVTLRETAAQAFAQAEKAEAKDKLFKALKLYSAVPEGAPDLEKAKAKIAELKPRAIEQELTLAEKELKSKATWPRAHRRYKDVLEVDPESPRALKGVRTVERKMRAKNMRFGAWIPANPKMAETKETPQEIEDAIAKRYPGDDELAKVARLYAQGSLQKAIKKAEALEKKATGPRRETVKQVLTALTRIQTKYELIRNEISNNPNQAWSLLMDIQTQEQSIEPKEVKSYLRRELEESIAEAFADSGASLFDRGRYEDAFDLWSSGYKLDPMNPKALAGLKKLEEKAKQYADEAELAAQRGEKDVCSRWKRITKMARPESEIYKKAFDRAKSACAV
jgi:pSer/pThr/pTyr-binding forkhead associated (FHA) protein/tetratricopeptide (TPR) repeat protein